MQGFAFMGHQAAWRRVLMHRKADAAVEGVAQFGLDTAPVAGGVGQLDRVGEDLG